MTNPQDINTKYPTIPFGQFQGIIDKESYDEYRERELDLGNTPMSYEVWMELNTPYPAKVVADAQDKLLSKLMKPKSRVEASDIVNIIDNDGRELEVFYRVIDCCDNPQTDEGGDNYTIEQVLFKGKKANLSGRGEQELLTWLNEKNPAGLKYSVRA